MRGGGRVAYAYTAANAQDDMVALLLDEGCDALAKEAIMGHTALHRCVDVGARVTHRGA